MYDVTVLHRCSWATVNFRSCKMSYSSCSCICGSRVMQDVMSCACLLLCNWVHLACFRWKLYFEPRQRVSVVDGKPWQGHQWFTVLHVSCSILIFRPLDIVLSVLWHCWFGDMKRIWPVKNLSAEVLAWLSVWSEVQMTCIWSSWCHCHPVISINQPNW